ncbi:MAG: sulfite exporter TauE/SafE family protein [Spirosomataceae bacterium]
MWPHRIGFARTPRSKAGKLTGIFLYNVGRATTYALLGLLLGSLGSALNLAGLQRSLSIGTGILMLTAVAYSSHWLDQLSPPFFLQKGVQVVKKVGNPASKSKFFGTLYLGYPQWTAALWFGLYGID